MSQDIYAKSVRKDSRAWGVPEERTYAYNFFKAVFSHLFYLLYLFLFFTSLMEKGKLSHLERLTLLLNIDQLLYIAFDLITQYI